MIHERKERAERSLMIQVSGGVGGGGDTTMMTTGGGTGNDTQHNTTQQHASLWSWVRIVNDCFVVVGTAAAALDIQYSGASIVVKMIEIK